MKTSSLVLVEQGVILGDLIGSISIAMDLARGHPLETSLRVCRLACALAEQLGSTCEQRRDAYYTSLLRYCPGAKMLVTRLGLGDGVARGVRDAFERWDGTGAEGVHGTAISFSARLTHVAHAAELQRMIGGIDSAREAIASGAGARFDPNITAAFEAVAAELLPTIEPVSVWTLALGSEPEPRVVLAHYDLDRLLETLADFVDSQSVFTIGHSRRVAGLAVAAGDVIGLDDREREVLRRAALAHDLGRLSIPASIWDKPGALSAPEWDRVRLRRFYTGAVLDKSPALLEVVAVATAIEHASQGARARGPSVSTRILEAADACCALSESRPHRPAHSSARAARILADEVKSGRLDGRAVQAVLEVSGHRRLARGTWPGGLSAREVDVLRWLARGHSNKQIASKLTISHRTVQHHVQNIYAKIGVSNRAAAARYATEYDLAGE